MATSIDSPGIGSSKVADPSLITLVMRAETKLNLSVGSFKRKCDKFRDGLASDSLNDVLKGILHSDLLKLRDEIAVNLDDVYMSLVEAEYCEERLEEALDNKENTLFDLNYRLGQLNLGLDLNPRACAEVSLPAKSQFLEFKLPKISIDYFYDSSKDPYAFFHFKKQFENALISSGSKLTNIQKLIYLKSLLRGKALSLVENFPLEDASYHLTVSVLEREFFDVDLIIDEIYSSMTSASKCNSLSDVNMMLDSWRLRVIELQQLGLDFLCAHTAGLSLLSKLLRDKLPNFYLREVCKMCNSPYPTVQQIFDSSSDLSKILADRSKSSVSEPVQRDNKNVNKILKTKPDTEQKTSSSSKFCKLCSQNTHTVFWCPKYNTHASRVARAEAITLCALCLSNKHATSGCSGKKAGLPYMCNICKTSTHAAPMCPKYTAK